MLRLVVTDCQLVEITPDAFTFRVNAEPTLHLRLTLSRRQLDELVGESINALRSSATGVVTDK